ncbi:hypothetical protein WJX72_011797 [[Myrmecia] bisecta]|uniref:Uncharacterized protein n=1 Tax=[Myrmecia] bisecta TaxID=41462 RepID=A0AAW1QGL6_9CHLO
MELDTLHNPDVESTQPSQPVQEPDESDDDFQYEEVEVISDDEDDSDVVSEDLESALRSLQSLTTKAGPQGPAVDGTPRVPAGQVTKRPEVVDDFIRNFLVKMNLNKTLEMFETEWYELKVTGKLDSSAGKVPDLYSANLQLEEVVGQMRAELVEAQAISAKASATWDKFRKERDFHRMHHKRVAQEKNKLIVDIQRLKKHYSMYEPTIEELRHKYEVAMKEKMLVRLEKERLAARVEALEAQARRQEPERDNNSLGESDKGSGLPGQGLSSGKLSRSSRPTGASLPGGTRVNPFADVAFPPANVKDFVLQKTFKGHTMSVSQLALHPTKPILVTASDDKTWKMWHLPKGDLIMSGEGHKDWVAGVDFHPKGTHLASASGDSTVKIWSFEQQKCVATYSDHNNAVWGVAFHDSADFVASCSLDHSVRLWDLTTGKCRQSLRGHVDSVNDVCWQPFSNNLCTGSSDKTVSIWDARSGLCTQTFYGHHNSVNGITFNIQGSTVASTDADGVAKLWDVRMVAEILSMDTSGHPANKCCFDRSGDVLAVASDNGKVLCFNAINGEAIVQLQGHEDAVQAVVFDQRGETLISAGSDHTFRVWG